MKIIYPYCYCLYSYFISPYLFTSTIPNITPFHIHISNTEGLRKEKKKIVFVPLLIDNNYLKCNVSETKIRKFIQRIKKYEFPKEMKIPLEDY